MLSQNILIPLLLSFLTGSSTVIGGLLSIYIKKFNKAYLAFSLGLSAGVMVYISFLELIPSSIKEIGVLPTNFAFFGGMILVMIIDFLIPHELIEGCSNLEKENKMILTTGVTTALAIAVHNFPEGIAVFMSSLENIKLGIPLFLAIAIHNIPEGMAVAVPIYYATRNKRKSLVYSFFSGMTEPLGAIIAFLLLAPFLTPAILSLVLAIVAGIMVYISFDELLPVCFKSCEGHYSIIGIISGMVIMAISLYLF
ncbi:zinc transporter ZupT [Candidatus Gottesmanbacteria bacterium]|nr:zinc transporter ZupT [Candidatus Gottesmanbacteria bacterium]